MQYIYVRKHYPTRGKDKILNKLNTKYNKKGRIYILCRL